MHTHTHNLPEQTIWPIWPYKAPFLPPNPDISDDGSNEQVRSVFQTKQGRKSIDIYWISDDGGEHYT